MLQGFHSDFYVKHLLHGLHKLLKRECDKRRVAQAAQWLHLLRHLPLTGARRSWGEPAFGFAQTTRAKATLHRKQSSLTQPP